MSVYCKDCKFSVNGCNAPEHIKENCSYYSKENKRPKIESEVEEEHNEWHKRENVSQQITKAEDRE